MASSVLTVMVVRSASTAESKVSAAAAIDAMLAEKQPSHRLSSPSEIARLAVWLCATEAHNVTGTAIPIDGGWTAQ